MANRPPFDRDAPPPGGFDPRFDGRVPDEGPRLRRDDPRSREYEEDPFAAGPRDRSRPVERRGMPRSTLILLVLGGLLLLGAIVFGLSLGRSGAGDDKLGANAEGQETSEAAADPGARCAAPATADLIKRELFRQAAATRGSDQAVFDQLAGYSALRVSRPVLREKDEGLQRVSCGADLALDLPPGVAVVGGRRTLTASVSYDLQPGADGSGDVLVLRGADGITVPLATLARSGSQPAPVDVPAPPVTDQPTPDEPAPDINPPPPPEPVAPEPAPVTSAARPSFNCARARTSGEVAVCGSDSLAALDRQMASFYVQALRDADPAQRALLQRTRDRFLTFRDRCDNDRCIADAYRGRISEIRDIVDGRWRGN